MPKKQYLTNCTESTSELIDAMVENATEITYDTFVRNCDTQEWQRSLEYVVGSGRQEGLRMKDDYAVSYWKSSYNGQPCYYVVQSSIEWIFV